MRISSEKKSYYNKFDRRKLEFQKIDGSSKQSDNAEFDIYFDDEGNTRYFSKDCCTVQFLSTISFEKIDLTLKKHGSKIIDTQRTKNYFTISLPLDMDLFEFLTQLNKEDIVEFAEPNELLIADQESPNINKRNIEKNNETKSQFFKPASTPDPKPEKKAKIYIDDFTNKEISKPFQGRKI